MCSIAPKRKGEEERESGPERQRKKINQQIVIVLTFSSAEITSNAVWRFDSSTISAACLLTIANNCRWEPHGKKVQPWIRQ
jgi:hypothetical protein